MSAPDHAATMPPCSIATVLRIGRRRYTLTWRPPRRVAPLLVRLLARVIGARAAWGRPAAALAAVLLAAVAAPSFAAPPSALPSNALPAGATLAAGQAAVTQAGNRMDIVQQTGKAILNWDSFNIGSGAAVTFRQPGADAVILNRVAGNAPSQLLGSLSANGKVWLVNPAGIMVGQGATIDLHGFVASTLAVRDSDFLAGRMLFGTAPQSAQTAQAGAVRNDGAIATPSGGSVYLVAPDVQNHGLISAPGGEVLLAAGASVELIDTATPGVRVAITGTQGSAVNLGRIVSTAGRIGMAGVLVKNSGILNAGSVVSEGGRIFLRASKDAVVDGHAQVQATGVTGGRIEVTGERVGVLDAAVLDASGALGGGAVLAGGELRGGDGLPRAQSAVLAQDAVLRADALVRGDGGKVVLWSDGATLAQGTVSARGGAQGGNGGLAETSGRQRLAMDSLRADTSAPLGKAGTLLLDPANIVIGTVADVDGTGGGVDAGSIAVDPVTGLVKLAAGTYTGTSQMTAASVGALLATTNVSLEAATDITVSTQISKTAGGDQTLSFSAGHNIALNQPITSTSGALALTLSAGGSIVADTFGSQSLNGGVLTAAGENGVQLGNVVAGSVSASSTSGSVSVNAPGALTLSGSAGSQYVVTAGGDVTLASLSAGGDISLNADGHNVTFGGGTLSSGQTQSYRGILLLTGNTTITSGGTADFNGTWSSAAGAPTLAVNNTGLATFGGAVGGTPLGGLTVSGAALLKGNVTTTGAQAYGGQLQIAANTVLKASGVTLSSGGTGSAGGAPAALSVQAQNIALAGAMDSFTNVVTSGTLAASSLNMASPWTHSGTLNAAGVVSTAGGLKITGGVTLAAGAKLTLASSAADTVSGVISGDGGVVKTGSGVTTFNGANTYGGDTQVDGGTLKLTAAQTLGGKLAVGSGGTLSLGADIAIGGLFSSAGTLNGTGTLTAAGGYRLDGATIAGKLGTGTLTQASGSSVLSGTYGGATVNVTGGTLAFGAANCLPATAEVTVGDSGTLDTAGYAQTVKNVTSTGTLTAGSGGTLSATEAFTLNGGTVSGALSGNAVVQNAGTLNWSGTFSGNAIRLQGGTMHIGSGGVQAGTAFLATSSGTALSVAGPTSIVYLQHNGVLDVNAALTLGSAYSENAGVININGSEGRLLLTGTTLASVASGVVALAGTHAAPISGTGTFSNTGTFSKSSAGAQSAILTANTAAGKVSVDSGTLTVSGLTANAGTVTTAAGATLSTGGATLTNQSSGILAGNGTIAADVVNLGAIAPGGAGSIGALTINGTLDTSAGTVNTELTSAASYDKLAATGAVTVGASTVINRTDLAGAYVSGDVFDIVQSTASAIAGTAPAVSGFAVDKVHPSYFALRLTSQAGDNFWIRQSGAAYVSGAWEDAANWQLGLPTAAQLVHIARPDTLTVTLGAGSGPATIAGLVLGPANTLALADKASLLLGARASQLSGTISLGSGASIARAGSLTLEDGGVLLGSGTVDVGAGTFFNKGRISPGGAGIGTLAIKGNFEQGSGGMLEAALAGHGAGQSDALTVTGNVTLDGSFSAALAAGYSAEPYQPVAVVTTGGARSGTFKTVALPAEYQAGYALADGEAVRADYLPGATAYFNNAAGTMAWKDNGNWSGGKAPGNADRVVIDTSRALAMENDKYAVATLTVTPGAVLAVAAGSLATKHGTVVDGTLRLSGGVDASLDTLSGAGTLALDGGALALTGSAPVIASVAMTGGTASIGKAKFTVANYMQSGGALSGDNGSALAATAAFSQTGGTIAGLSSLELTQAAGNMTLGTVTAESLKATSAGNITQGAGTALSLQHLQLSADGNVELAQANTIAAVQGRAGGTLSVQGMAAVDGTLTAGGDMALGGANLAISAAVTSTGGNVALVADEVDVLGGSVVASAGGAANFIKVTSATASQPIKFSAQGGEDTGAGLLLYARDMAAFTTPTLVVGDATHTGMMSLNDGGAISAPNVSGTIRFVNNGGFTRSGAETISANGLDVTAVGGIVLDGINHVKSFTAANSGSGDIVLTNNSDTALLALGAISNPAGAVTIDNTGGVSLSGPGAVSAAGKVSLTAHSPVSINAAITSGGGIAVTASTGITLGAAARLTNTASVPVSLLAQNGALVLDAGARINSGGGVVSLEARGASGAVSVPAGTVSGGPLVVNSTELDDIAAQAAADAAAKAAAEAEAKAAADKAAAEAAAKAAAEKAAAEAAAKAAADKAAAAAAAKAAADKAAAEAAAKAAAEKAAAEAAAKAASDKAAAEAAAKAAADKAAAEAAAKAAADKAAAEAAAKAAADKAAAEAAAKAAADKAAAEAAAKAAADKAAAEAAARAAEEAAAKAAADKAAGEAAAKAAADAATKAAADAAAKAAAEKAAQEVAAKAAAEKAVQEAAAKAAAKAAADEAARQAAENAAKAASSSAKSQATPQQTQQPPQDSRQTDSKPQDSNPQGSKSSDGKLQDSKAQDVNPQDSKASDGKLQDSKAQDSKDSKQPETKAADSTQGGQQDVSSQAGPSTVASSAASVALAQTYEQQTIGGGAGSFGGDAGTAAGDGKDNKESKDGKADTRTASHDKAKKAAKKMAVCK